MQVLLTLLLNYPWRAAAASAMVRSTLLVPTAAIGAVRLAAPIRAAWALVAALPACSPAIEQAVALYVALRIDTLIHLIH